MLYFGHILIVLRTKCTPFHELLGLLNGAERGCLASACLLAEKVTDACDTPPPCGCEFSAYLNSQRPFILYFRRVFLCILIQRPTVQLRVKSSFFKDRSRSNFIRFMESLSPVFIPDAVGCLPCDEDATLPNQPPPTNNAGVYVPTLISINPASHPAVLGAAKKISGSSSLPMLLPAQTRPTGLLLPVSMTLRSNPPSQVASIPKKSENLDYITPKRPSSLPPSLAATVVPLALSASNSNSFRDIASAIVNFPVELVDTQREVVKSLDVVAASVKGLFSLHFIILGDAITLATRSSAKGLVFLGFLELAQVDVNAVPLQLVESTLSVEGKAIPLGKYKSWLRIRHQQSNEYFVSCGSESDVVDLHALLASLISKAPNMSYSVLNASPKPPACAGHTFVTFSFHHDTAAFLIPFS